MKKNKVVLLAVTGGIASYKACELVRLLVEQGIEVHVIMTENATKFVTPLTFSALSGNTVQTEEFPSDTKSELLRSPMTHIELARRADLLLVAPATANTIAKMACGIADNLVTSTVLAYRGKVLFAPAMNSAMWENPVTQENIRKLTERGFILIEPGTGFLACGEIGPGRIAEPAKILQEVLRTLNAQEGSMSGVKVLVTGGATREHLDPVRFITNASTGTLALKCADRAYIHGAEVTFIACPSVDEKELNLRAYRIARVTTAEELLDAILSSKDADILLMFAGVSDFAPEFTPRKIKKEEIEKLTLELRRTPDVLTKIGKKSAFKVKVGVSIDTHEAITSAKKKLDSKGLDAIVAVSLEEEAIPFGESKVKACIITKDETRAGLAIYDKSQLAEEILKVSLNLLKNKELKNYG